MNNISMNVHKIVKIKVDEPHQLDGATWVRHITFFIEENGVEDEFAMSLFSDELDTLRIKYHEAT